MNTYSNPFAWMHKRISSILCAGRPDALSLQGNAGISPPRSLFGWKVRGSAFHFVLQAKPVPLKHMEMSSKGAECLMWGCPCCLPDGGSSFLARKHFCSLFSINQVFHIKKTENGKLFLFLIIGLCFLDGLVLLESWLNADFSIFIGRSNNVKLYFSSCIMQDWFSG